MAMPKFSLSQFLNLCERSLVTMAPGRITHPRHVEVHCEISRVYTAIKFGGAPFKIDMVDKRRGVMTATVEFPSTQRGGARFGGEMVATLPTLERLELAEEAGKSWME